MKIFFVVICIGLVLFLGKYLFSRAQTAVNGIAKGTVNIISKSIGDDMQLDQFGNINILVVGYGGTGHAGSFLADSLMVASFNPKLGAITMISLPRDLYVHEKQRGIVGRINEIFAVGVGSKRQYHTGAKLLSDLVGEILGLDIPYYALVDFNGFTSVIDTLGGITLDVPKGFTDYAYPTENNLYMTIHFDSGIQEMDGEKALQYARSRHSTSDFARSLRQQQILEAIVTKFKSQGLKSVTKIKGLYEDYTNMVKTNISMEEIIGMAKYVYRLKHTFSYGLTTECSNITYKYSYPGCFLYTPSRDLFDGASIILPVGGLPGKISYYDYTKNFTFYVVHNQGYLIEGAKISVMNGIDKTFAKQKIRKSEGFANQMAVKLRKFAFDVVDVRNFGQTISGTTAYILTTGQVDETIKTLKNFLPITHIQRHATGSGFDDLTGVDIALVLGNDYIDTLVNTTFNYYK